MKTVHSVKIVKEMKASKKTQIKKGLREIKECLKMQTAGLPEK
ncbi:hypothetical protein KCO_15677 [Pectobacterium brasiliense ICMP 19477]|nr:hypothetical protein KCO_15677 [Pectobacterium brasiliense ICMP 19477]